MLIAFSPFSEHRLSHARPRLYSGERERERGERRRERGREIGTNRKNEEKKHN